MLIKKRKIQSFLPVFNGFYGTLFEPDEDSIIESPFNYDDYEFEYDAYKHDISKACCHAIERELKPLGITLEFDNLCSPREYNFTNDSINCTYKLSAKSARLLNTYLLKNKEAFEKYIQRTCTSYDGFISFFSNDVNEWFTTYTYEKLETSFGTMLEFYFENEGFTSENLYEQVCDVDLQGGLKTGVQEANDFIRKFANDNYITKPIETLVIELTQHFENEAIQYDWLTFGYIETIVKEVFSNIDNKTLNLFANKKK